MTGYINFEEFIETNLCRVCQKENGIENIFENSGDRRVSYADMITFCTSIVIADYDLLPKRVCSKCSKTLIELYDFSKTLFENENKLQEFVEKHLDNKVNNDSLSIKIKKEIDCEQDFSEGNINNENLIIKTDTKDHTGERPFECSICRKKFNRKTTLDSHKKIHTEEKCYICEICGKTFRHAGTLTYHMRSHTGETPYKCELCHKGFVHSGNLNKHMRFHSGEKRHGCKICYKTFSTESHLTQHTKAHNNDKAYKCSICGKAFVRSDYLKNHLVTHTNEKPYSCGICSKTFSQSGHRSRHMKKHKK